MITEHVGFWSVGISTSNGGYLPFPVLVIERTGIDKEEDGPSGFVEENIYEAAYRRNATLLLVDPKFIETELSKYKYADLQFSIRGQVIIAEDFAAAQKAIFIIQMFDIGEKYEHQKQTEEPVLSDGNLLSGQQSAKERHEYLQYFRRRGGNC